MTTTKTIKATELQIGNIVHFYGARFEVLSTNIKDGVLSSSTKWLDGNQVVGYFGEGLNWNVQGNDLRLVEVEV